MAFEPYSVFVCESQPVVIEGLRSIIASTPDFQFIGGETNLQRCLEGVSRFRPNLVLVDQAPGLRPAVQFLADVKIAAPDSRPILWVSDLPEIECFRVIQSGARAVLRKAMPVASILECFRAVASGSVWVDGCYRETGPKPSLSRETFRLTVRERQIVDCVCRGLKNREIAAELDITPGTVKVHLMHIFEKTGVKDRFELAVQARRVTGENGSAGLNGE